MDNKEQQFHEDIRTLRRLIPIENEDEISVNLPQYRGLSFKEFWEALPNKLEYYDYEEELTSILENNKKLWIIFI